MLKITKPSQNRLDIELRGPMDAETMALALDDLVAQSEGIEHGRMLYSIPEFEWPTAGALAGSLDCAC